MKNNKLELLLKNKPKLLKGGVPQFDLQVNQAKEFSLGLDKNLFQTKGAYKLIRPTQAEEKKVIQEEVKVEQKSREVERILETPVNEEPIEEKFSYRNEEEKTKKFLIDALDGELNRLNQKTDELIKKAEEEQQKMSDYQKINEEVEAFIKKQVKDQELIQRVKYLEDQIQLDKELRMKNPQRLDVEFLNAQMDEIYSKNQEFIERAEQMKDEIMKQLNLREEDLE